MCKNEANCFKLNNFRRAILYSTAILPLNIILGALKEKSIKFSVNGSSTAFK